MNTITLFEYEQVAFDLLGWDQDDPKIDALDAANRAAGKELIRIERQGLKATQHVGIMRIQNLTIQVLPKVDERRGPERDPGRAQRQSESSALHNLLHMLAYAMDLPFRSLQRAALTSRQQDWFELLTGLFANELHSQLILGPHRAYVTIENRLPILKGKWLVARQIRERPYQWHTLDISYDEFSQDNPINRVFRYVTDQLLSLSNDPLNRQVLSAIKAWLIDVPLVFGMSEALVSSVTFNRLNRRFLTAFDLAQLFLSSGSFEMAPGQRTVFSFMMDMNDLFEEFVAGFLRKHWHSILPNTSARYRVETQGGPHARYLLSEQPSGARRLRLIPDILIVDRTGRPHLILDTKYKELQNQSSDLGLAEGDVYQMLAYMTRYECPVSILLYPSQFAYGPLTKSYDYESQALTTQISTVDLHRSLADPDDLISSFRSLLAPTLSEA